MARCKTCQAEIKWAKKQAGGWMPLDLPPNPEGNVTVDENNVLRVRVGPDRDEEVRRGTTMYMAHHVTCPDRAQWGGHA